VLDNVNPDLSDSEFIEQDDELEAQTPRGHSEPGHAGIPGEGADGDESYEDGDEGEADGDIDEELSTELDREPEGETTMRTTKMRVKTMAMKDSTHVSS
jgi:transcription initiation factor TFIID subunit 7